jgi:hypothetical protein
VWSFSLAAAAAAQLLYNPAGHAQDSPQGEPEAQIQDSDVAPPPPYSPPPRPAPAYGPFVTLRSDHPRARLQVMGPFKWQDVCMTPCRTPVPPGGLYRVGGGSLRPSESFNLPRSGPVVIDAQMGSNVKHWIGFGLVLGGIGAAIAGGLFYASASDASDYSTLGGPSARDTQQAYGIIYMITGAILLAIGIPLAASSTSVEVH